MEGSALNTGKDDAKVNERDSPKRESDQNSKQLSPRSDGMNANFPVRPLYAKEMVGE